jgi:hypothetical protein
LVNTDPVAIPFWGEQCDSSVERALEGSHGTICTQDLRDRVVDVALQSRAALQPGLSGTCFLDASVLLPGQHSAGTSVLTRDILGSAVGSTIRGSGTGRMKRPPRAAYADCCLMISGAKFQASRRR